MATRSEINMRHEAKRRSEGWHRLALWLPADDAQYLQEVADQMGTSRVQVLRWALDRMRGK